MSGFWNRVIDKRTEIEARKHELTMEAQIGTRSHPFLGDIMPGIKRGYHSITKYPRMLLAGAGVIGTSGDTTVDMPSMPESFSGSDLETDLKRSAELKQQRLDAEKTAYLKMFNGEKPLWTSFKEYTQYKNVAQHSKYKDGYILPKESSLVSNVATTALSIGSQIGLRHALRAGAVGAGLLGASGVAMSGGDAIASSAADLGALSAPSFASSGVLDTLARALI